MTDDHARAPDDTNHRQFPRRVSGFAAAFAQSWRGWPVLATACRAGFQSVRERWRAVAVLWTAAALVVALYYLLPGVSALLEPVGRWQRANGWLASLSICGVFCGLIPYAVYRIRRESGKRSPLVVAMAQAVWCGLCGVVCGWFFSLQGRWFGCGHDLATVLKKMVVEPAEPADELGRRHSVQLRGLCIPDGPADSGSRAHVIGLGRHLHWSGRAFRARHSRGGSPQVLTNTFLK